MMRTTKPTMRAATRAQRMPVAVASGAKVTPGPSKPAEVPNADLSNPKGKNFDEVAAGTKSLGELIKKLNPREDNAIARAKAPKQLSTVDSFGGDEGTLKKKDFVDTQGRKGTGKGVYQYANKYGGNIDAYAPIYNPNAFGDDFITGCDDKTFAALVGFLVVVFGSFPILILVASGKVSIEALGLPQIF